MSDNLSLPELLVKQLATLDHEIVRLRAATVRVQSGGKPEEDPEQSLVLLREARRTCETRLNQVRDARGPAGSPPSPRGDVEAAFARAREAHDRWMAATRRWKRERRADPLGRIRGYEAVHAQNAALHRLHAEWLFAVENCASILRDLTGDQSERAS